MKSLSSLKARLKRSYLGSRVYSRLVSAYCYDLKRYSRYSSTIHPADRERANLAAKVTERYHSIEKGLSLPDPRPGFGRVVIPRLVKLVDKYVAAYGQDEVSRAAAGALRNYLQFNAESGLVASEVPGEPAVSELLARVDHSVDSGGTTPMTRMQVHSKVKGVELEFFTSRHSTRMFDSMPVDPGEIEFAARAAMASPAVCNREFSGVTVWTDPELVREILVAHGGARGFEGEPTALAMITVAPRAYWGAAERNQAWIDGGLFAMGFLLGLHAQGLGAVALNWSREPVADRAMRRLVALADDRSIVMFVAFGNLRDNYLVARSSRRDLNKFLTVGEAGRGLKH